MSKVKSVLNTLNHCKLALFATVVSLSIGMVLLWIGFKVLGYFILIERGEVFAEFNYAAWHHRLADSPVTFGLVVYLIFAYILFKSPRVAYRIFEDIVDLWDDSIKDANKSRGGGRPCDEERSGR